MNNDLVGYTGIEDENTISWTNFKKNRQIIQTFLSSIINDLYFRIVDIQTLSQYCWPWAGWFIIVLCNKF